MKKGIDYDEIINHRVNRNYLITLFNMKQNEKIINPLRIALHNKTIENIHFLYNRDQEYFKQTDLNNYYKENIMFKNNFNDELCFIPYD